MSHEVTQRLHFGSEQKGTDLLKTVFQVLPLSISVTQYAVFTSTEKGILWRFGIYLLNTGHTQRKIHPQRAKPPCDHLSNWLP